MKNKNGKLKIKNKIPISGNVFAITKVEKEDAMKVSFSLDSGTFVEMINVLDKEMKEKLRTIDIGKKIHITLEVQ